MSHASHVSADGKVAHSIRLAIGFAAIYFCADRSLDFVAFNKGWSILWPLNGATVALLLMRRRADWPAMLFGVALGTGLGELFDNRLVSEILQRIFSLTEVLLCALILPPFTTLDEWLRRRHVYRRFCAALLLGPGISGIMAAIWWHHNVKEPYLNAFNDWATADALGIAVTMPLALSLRSSEMRALFKSYELTRTLGILALTLATCALVFLVIPFPLFFVIYPALLLVDSSLGFAGSALAMPVACLFAVYAETTGHGPFGRLSQHTPISPGVSLQIFLGFQALALFPASIQFRQRRLLQMELKKSNLQLATLASLDGLTGIPNRRFLDEHFAMEWKLAGRMRRPLTLLMIDIDHFKQFNDLYGHQAGDACLQKVAGLLAMHVRRSRDMAARFGGEEFAVLLPDTTEDGVRRFTERALQALQSLAIPHQGSTWGRVTISVGCASRAPDMMYAQEELLKLADAALYKAKRSGRNNVQFDFPGQTATLASVINEPAPEPAIKG